MHREAEPSVIMLPSCGTSSQFGLRIQTRSLLFRLCLKLPFLVELIVRVGSSDPEPSLSYAALGQGCWGKPPSSTEHFCFPSHFALCMSLTWCPLSSIFYHFFLFVCFLAKLPFSRKKQGRKIEFSSHCC